DYLDLLYLHVWDTSTPIDEILRGFDDLVQQGKVRYVGISNSPAWQIARMQTLADIRGWAPLAALQLEYSLIERTGERDVLPLAQELGFAGMLYAPQAGGILTGKYPREDLVPGAADTAESSRKAFNLALGSVNERNLSIVDAVKEVTEEVDNI